MSWNNVRRIAAVAVGILSLCYIAGFVLNCYITAGYRLILNIGLLFNVKTLVYTILFGSVVLFIYLSYYYKHYWLINARKVIKGDKHDSDIAVNLEQARFLTDAEIDNFFPKSEYSELEACYTGIPVRAEQRGNKYNINLAPNAHTLIIGTTGSGKTTTYINPAIQILSETKDKPSMIIADPKGELFVLHAKALERKGYEIKILDLRNPFSSIKWNPLERPFIMYQRMLHLEAEITVNEEKGVCVFEGREFYNRVELDSYLQVKRQQLYDTVYEDLHDIITALCPITNRNEPIWESGAKNFCLAIALAMLEDSEKPELGMTIDKYNFFNLTKIATNTEDDCEVLIDYFTNRGALSKTASLSKQVIDSAEKTRGSYLSTLFDKLNMFSDMSLCSLTSSNEISFEDLAERPTAVFLQIPDERETRHTLAAMVILQAYKELVRKANTYPNLTLPRPVYFMLDEFGQLPAVHKLEQMITVGRSRNIWLNLVVQSYAQLAKVYDEKVAEIIKSNCNIQIFIGTTDLKTIEDFSKRCGNYSVITRNVGYNTAKADDINSNASIKERPLIYPSELAQLNRPGDMGNAIITIFGYQPIRSKFTPSFMVKAFNLEKTEEKSFIGKYFDEAKVFYDIGKRNKFFAKPKNKVAKGIASMFKQSALKIEQLSEQSERTLKEVLSPEEMIALLAAFSNYKLVTAVKIIEEANKRALNNNLDHVVVSISDLLRKIDNLMRGVDTALSQSK